MSESATAWLGRTRNKRASVRTPAQVAKLRAGDQMAYLRYLASTITSADQFWDIVSEADGIYRERVRQMLLPMLPASVMAEITESEHES